MAELVKWLTRRIVAPVRMGSIPIFRPIFLKFRAFMVLALLQKLSLLHNKMCDNRLKDIFKNALECVEKK